MGLYKEQAAVFDYIEKNQYQIWPDSADCGIKLQPTNKLWEDVKESMKHLDGFHKSFSSYGSKDSGNYGKAVTVFIPWEMDDGLYSGTEYTITYHVTNAHNSKKRIDFVNVFSRHKRTNVSPFIEDF